MAAASQPSSWVPIGPTWDLAAWPRRGATFWWEWTELRASSGLFLPLRAPAQTCCAQPGHGRGQWAWSGNYCSRMGGAGADYSLFFMTRRETLERALAMRDGFVGRRAFDHWAGATPGAIEEGRTDLAHARDRYHNMHTFWLAGHRSPAKQGDLHGDPRPQVLSARPRNNGHGAPSPQRPPEGLGRHPGISLYLAGMPNGRDIATSGINASMDALKGRLSS